MAIHIQYSTDGTTWSPYTIGDSITLANVGDQVSFKAADGVTNPAFHNSDDESCRFMIANGKAGASGNVMSLLKADCDTNLPGEAFMYLFSGCTNLTSAPEFPATTLSYECYCEMFSGCTNLTSAPELPATTLANYCYDLMFYDCTSLKSAPKLPATTLAEYCYAGMFSECTNLTIAPELPATTLAEGCYAGMFEGCTNLTTAPELPATTLEEECYENMFEGCTGLTTIPNLPATILPWNCYDDMFKGCTSLDISETEDSLHQIKWSIPATSFNPYSYDYMFADCGENVCFSRSENPVTLTIGATYYLRNQNYTITYNTNGGSAISKATNQCALPSTWPVCTRSGYTFEGWYTDEALTTPATPGASITKDTTLYAKWSKITAGQAVLVDTVKLTSSTPNMQISSIDFDQDIRMNDAENEAIAAGNNVNIFLEVSDTAVSTADQNAINEKVLANSYKMGQYVDISLMSMIAGDATSKRAMKETLNDIEISVNVPSDLINTDSNVERTYAVARLHDGQVDILDADFESETGELKFESGLFSSYAIVYKDTVKSNEENKTSTSESSSPKTGDHTKVAVMITMMLLCTCGVIICRKKFMK